MEEVLLLLSTEVPWKLSSSESSALSEIGFDGEELVPITSFRVTGLHFRWSGAVASQVPRRPQVTDMPLGGLWEGPTSSGSVPAGASRAPPPPPPTHNTEYEREESITDRSERHCT